MASMRTFVKSTIGKRAYGQLRQWRREFKQWLFFRQRIVEVQVGKFRLTAPSSHLLWTNRGSKAQPLRDQFIGLAAREVVKKYPEATILDVGANIGDTAAMIASYTTAPLILVEPSDYFLTFLAKNVQELPIHVKTVHQALISMRPEEKGILHHSRGTATFDRLPNARKKFVCKKLPEVADSHTRLIKIDTDGFDYQIIASAKKYLAETGPCLIFENWVESSEQLAESQANVELLREVGYRRFVIWDDPGHLHSSIRFVTPDDRHYGREIHILEKRHKVYEEARENFPGRWSGKTRNWSPVQVVMLNPEKNSENTNINLKQAA